MKIVKVSPKKSLNKAFLKQRPLRSEIELFKSTLIILLDKVNKMEICANHPNVTLNFDNLYHTTKVYSWVKKTESKEDYKYFLGIANSSLLWWFLKNTGDTLQGDARTFKTNYLNPFPLPKEISTESQKPFLKLVDKVISLKSQNQDTAEIEKEIDKLVYNLYGLSDEESKVIEQE